MMRRAILVLAMFGLAACATGQPGNSLFRQIAGDDGALTPPSSARYIALEQAGARAMQAVVEDRDQRDLLYYSHMLNGVAVWYGRDGVQIGLRDGIMVMTRGIGGDLMAADARQSLALLRAGRNGTAQRFHSYLTGNDQIETRSYVCDITRIQDFALPIGDVTLPTWYMKESCRGSDLIFENYYWIERRNGEIRQSRQLANPFSGRIAFQQVL